MGDIMFTGIITHLGKVQKISTTGLTVKVPDDLFRKLKVSGSISINGVCLTIIKAHVNSFSVNIMPETWKKTSFGNLQKSELVNLELPMQTNDLFEGHIVQGHVDAVGEIQEIKREDNSYLFTIKVSPKITKYIVEKGSIAVNGISLTVIEAASKNFTVGIIPYTWKKTMLHQVKVGEKLNIEVDILAKYIERCLKHLKRKGNL